MQTISKKKNSSGPFIFNIKNCVKPFSASEAMENDAFHISVWKWLHYESIQNGHNCVQFCTGNPLSS
jgi:hypothetical protein